MRLALFDLDNTLLAGDSDAEWGRFLVQIGAVDAEVYSRENERFYNDYKSGCLDIQAFLRFALAPLKAHPRATLDAWHEEFMRQVVSPMVAPGTAALLQQHRQAGDVMVIITATNRFVTGPIATLLGFTHLIATEVECDAAGQPTGESFDTPCFQHGKIERLHAWLAAQGWHWNDFAETWFYSDSRNDLPLLNQASHPVAVDPDPVLEAHARAAGWPVISLR
jgi:HAD superfamily hydrolase (TIGR01490 family)